MKEPIKKEIGPRSRYVKGINKEYEDHLAERKIKSKKNWKMCEEKMKF